MIDAIIKGAKAAWDFIALGKKPEPKLEGPLDELATEKAKQAIADRRRERANRKHGNQG